MKYKELVARYNRLNPEKEKLFLIELLFQLTIGFRAFSDKNDSAENGLKQLNEINHRVLNRLKSLTFVNRKVNKVGLFDQIVNHINIAPEIGGDVSIALTLALENVDA